MGEQETIQILRSALVGAWLDYDAIPYQMATDEYDAMQTGHLKFDSGEKLLYQMTEKDVDYLISRKDPYVSQDATQASELPVHGNAGAARTTQADHI